MKVVDVKSLEECVDRVAIREMYLSRPLNGEWIRALGRLGRLEYFAHFPKPFFRLTRKGEFIIKGVEGRQRCRVTFINYTEEAESGLIESINGLETD